MNCSSVNDMELVAWDAWWRAGPFLLTCLAVWIDPLPLPCFFDVFFDVFFEVFFDTRFDLRFELRGIGYTVGKKGLRRRLIVAEEIHVVPNQTSSLRSSQMLHGSPC